MKLEDLRAFTKIVDCESISEAARRHALPKASLSHSLRRLESYLGVDLFQRSGNRLLLSDAGKVLAAHAKNVTRSCELAEDAILEQRSSKAVHLKIGAPDELGTTLVGPLVLDFCRDNPEMNLDLRIMRVSELFHPDSDLDCIIYGGDPPEEEAKNMTARRFGKYVSRLYASPGYIERHGSPQTPEDLEAHDLILNNGETGAKRWSLSNGARRVIIRPEGYLSSNDNWIVKMSAVRDRGIGLFSDFFVDYEIRTGTLQPVLNDWVTDPRPLMALRHSHRHRNPHINSLIAFVLERFNGFYHYPYRDSDMMLRGSDQ